jgi:predicted ABC-type ATPase
MFEDKPLLIIFAGPNGSGKSTITENSFPDFKEVKYINADVIAKERGLSAYNAAVEATRLRAEAILNKVSFVMETVLSTPEKLNLMREAKAAGYHVRLVYITTQSSYINVDRVSARVREGGHDVPVDKTISRYDKSMGLVAEAAKIADTAVIYNNSFENPVLIAEKTLAKGWSIYPQKPPSSWTEQKISNLLKLKR